MDYKKAKVPHNTVSRDMVRLSADTQNVYETVMVIAKRANQIAQASKEELHSRLQEFASAVDNLEEVFDNEEQINLSKEYELRPKATLIAAHEYEHGELYHNISGRHKK